MTRARHVARSQMPKQLAWCKRSAEDGEMFVQLEPWARYAGKATWCGTSLSKKQFPASILVAHARHPSMLTSKGWFDSNFRRDEGDRFAIAVRKHVTA